MRNLLSIITRPTLFSEKALPEGYGKIPWDDPEFSRRMLQCHLSQEDDWASRRAGVIERQVERMVSLLPERAGAVLDLGCGPGLYTTALAARGFTCTGVDFSPASMQYAREQAADRGLFIDYAQADIRTYRAAREFDAVLLLFGELNAFSREEAGSILQNAVSALRPGGMMFLEVHTFDEIRRQGASPRDWQALESGLFCLEPHVLLQESFWNAEEAAAFIRYVIVRAKDGSCSEYVSRMCAYTDGEYRALFESAGLCRIQSLPESQWPTGEVFAGKLHCYACRQGG